MKRWQRFQEEEVLKQNIEAVANILERLRPRQIRLDLCAAAVDERHGPPGELRLPHLAVGAVRASGRRVRGLRPQWVPCGAGAHVGQVLPAAVTVPGHCRVGA